MKNRNKGRYWADRPGTGNSVILGKSAVRSPKSRPGYRKVNRTVKSDAVSTSRRLAGEKEVLPGLRGGQALSWRVE